MCPLWLHPQTWVRCVHGSCPCKIIFNCHNLSIDNSGLRVVQDTITVYWGPSPTNLLSRFKLQEWSTVTRLQLQNTEHKQQRCNRCLSQLELKVTCKLLNPNLTTQATKSDEQYFRLTVCSVLKDKTFVASVNWILRNSPIASKTLHTSQLFGLCKHSQHNGSIRLYIVHYAVRW